MQAQMQAVVEQMTGFIGIAALVIVALGAIALLAMRRGRGPQVKARPLMTENETEFLNRLEAAAPELRFHAQTCMGALLEPVVSRGADRTAYYRIRGAFGQKIVDYVAQRRDDGRIVAIIELDDRSHDPAKDARRDAMLAMAGYRVIRWQSRQKPDRAAIRAALIGQPSSQ